MLPQTMLNHPATPLRTYTAGIKTRGDNRGEGGDVVLK